MRSLLTRDAENGLLISNSRKFMLFFLPAVAARSISLASGAAVFHKIEDVVVRSASGAAANERLHAEPRDHHDQKSEHCFRYVDQDLHISFLFPCPRIP